MGGVVADVFVLLVLILGNGLFAMSEIAIVSARRARLAQRAEEGDLGARTALELAQEPNRLLSAVQIGISLVGVLSGAYGGATLAGPLSRWIARVPALAPYSGVLGFSVVVGAVTYASLILGELVPKRLALHRPERIAAAAARPMQLLARFASPLIFLLSASTDLVLRLFGIRQPAELEVSEEEIRVMVREGTAAGVIHAAEQEMVERVFRLGDRTASALMTPRPEIVWIDLEDTPEAVRRRIAASEHSRMPAAAGDLDEVQGIVQVKDLLRAVLEERPFAVRSAVRPALFVPENASALRLLELLRGAGTHIALVVDEFGGVQGLVTLHDVLTSLVGEVREAGAEPEPGIVVREDGSLLVDGMFPIDEFKAHLGLRELPGEDRGDFRTVGGFMMSSLGRIPSAADAFSCCGYRFEVMDMDGNRVDKVLVSREG